MKRIKLTVFIADLTFVPSGSTGAAQYDIDANPRAWLGAFAAFGDNTTGNRNMMMINGSTTATATVWEQTVSVVFDPFDDSARIG